jgi:hypothetical protein
MQEGRQTGRPRAAVRRFVSLRLPPPFVRPTITNPLRFAAIPSSRQLDSGSRLL